jgi:imidazolonepropionase
MDLLGRTIGFVCQIENRGVTSFECKSGYGLTTADELRLLRVYATLRRSFHRSIVSTFLGAHTVPPEYQSDRSGYVKLVCDEMIPRVAAERLATFCDVFVEKGAFTPDEARTIFAAAKKHGLRPKLHADQLADGGGAALAAEVGADFNPGSAPCYDLPLAMTLACTMNRLTPAEALRGATINAAKAIGIEGTVGSLEVGKRADFVLVEAESVDQWLYHYRTDSVKASYIGGKPYYAADGYQKDS